MKRIYNNNSIIKLKELVERKEGNKYIIGDKETGVYVSISPEAYEILKLFKRNIKVKEIKNIVIKKFGKVNLDVFIKNLISHGFVKSIDGKEILETKRYHKKWFLNFIKPKYVSFLFSRTAYLIYTIIILSALLILIKNPNYFPRFQDYFFTDKKTILIVLSFILGWLLVFIHEISHFLAARSLNIPASFGITNRLYFLVAITDVTNIYSVERKKRYRVYLAGIFVELLIISSIIITLFLSDNNIISISESFYLLLKFLKLIAFLGVVWQFYFFLRTDIYYAFENFFNIQNLNKKTNLLIRQRIKELLRWNKKHTHLKVYFENKREYMIVKFYTIFFVVGIMISILLLIFYEIPIAYKLLKSSFESLFSAAILNNKTLFYDSLIFLFIWMTNQALLAYALIRNYKLYQKTIFYWVIVVLLFLSNYIISFLTIIILLVNLRTILQFYIALFILGFLFGVLMIWVVEKLNKISEEIIIEIAAPAITLIVSNAIVSFVRIFIIKTGLRTMIINSMQIVGLLYAVGIAVAYIILLSLGIHKSVKKIF